MKQLRLLKTFRPLKKTDFKPIEYLETTFEDLVTIEDLKTIIETIDDLK